ncbi:SWIB/MDM2 domain-containing protein [Trametes elegans]|nr:SWIB/MDM2 domain-containing protein [Trametes elegans]
MFFDVSTLEPRIRAILTAPGTDLATISAKRVRKELVDGDDDLTPELVKEKKDEIDLIISRVYEEVSAARAAADEDGAGGAKRKRGDASEGGEDEEEEDAAPVQTKAKKSRKKEGLTDEEIARQLSNEINGRGRTSRAAASSKTKTKANGAKRGKKGPKSSATVASDGEEGESEAEEGAKPKKRGGGFKKEYLLSEPLSALLKIDKLSRPQTVKQLWDHIKANNMQNPTNKKEIICDDSFKAIFKVDKIDMFEMNRQLGKHLQDPASVAS